MSINSATLFSLAANATLAIFTAALVLLILWQDLRRRSNQYFALCMVIFGLYGALNIPMHVAQQAGIEPEPLLKVLTTLYIAGLILLFNFVLSFADMLRPHRWRERAVSLPLAAGFMVLLWSGRIYTDFAPRSDGGYSYRIQPVGWVVAVIAVIYLVGIVIVLRRLNNPRSRDLSAPVALLVLGVIGFSFTPGVRSFSLNTVIVTAAVVMLGRVVIKYQVFQPLADLTTELDQKVRELYEATQAKSRFLANMSHELRTPLNSIIGYTELVTKGTYGGLAELQHDRLQKVNRNGRVLLELINDVLDLSKIEAGRMTLNLETLPTTELLDNLLNEFRPQADEKGLSLVRGYGQLPAVRADKARARQIMVNLLSNAIKFTDAGAVIVRGHYDAQRQLVVVTITDTGPGIAPERQDRLFDAYLDSESLLTRQREGTGLGLAIAHQLAAIHDGDLWFNSTPGQGTTFHIGLPPAEPPVSGTVLEPRARRGPLILAIDDDYEALEVLQGHLEAQRFRVCGVDNPNDGLRLAHELHPALITLDVLMPGINGWQVLESLRRDPVTAPIPVIIVSAMDGSDQAKAAGAQAFLRKPALPETLLAEIRRQLAGRRLATEERQEVRS